MTTTRMPSAMPIAWEVRRKKDGVVLGVVTERRWFDAREEACQRYGVDRGDIEVSPLPDKPIDPTANGIKKHVKR